MRLLFLMTVLGATMAAQAQPTMRAGAAQVAITPPVGAPMAGYYHSRGAEGALDPLYAKALVIDDGATKVALVALDLISTTVHFTREARAKIEKATGIPG